MITKIKKSEKLGPRYMTPVFTNKMTVSSLIALNTIFTEF